MHHSLVLKISESKNASNLGGSSFYVINGVDGSKDAIDFLGQTFAENDELYQNILNSNNVMATYLAAENGDTYKQEVEFFNNQKIYEDISNWTKEIPAVNYGLQTYQFEDILKAEIQKIINSGVGYR